MDIASVKEIVRVPEIVKGARHAGFCGRSDKPEGENRPSSLTPKRDLPLGKVDRVKDKQGACC